METLHRGSEFDLLSFYTLYVLDLLLLNTMLQEHLLREHSCALLMSLACTSCTSNSALPSYQIRFPSAQTLNADPAHPQPCQSRVPTKQPLQPQTPPYLDVNHTTKQSGAPNPSPPSNAYGTSAKAQIEAWLTLTRAVDRSCRPLTAQAPAASSSNLHMHCRISTIIAVEIKIENTNEAVSWLFHHAKSFVRIHQNFVVDSVIEVWHACIIMPLKSSQDEFRNSVSIHFITQAPERETIDKSIFPLPPSR